MATIKTTTPAARMNMLFWAFIWIVIIGFSLKFIITAALPYFSLNPETLGRWLEYKWWLIGHISGGLLALVLGPFQFWNRFRTRYLRIHRLMGRLYLIGIVIGFVASTYLAWTTGLAVNTGWAVGLQGLALAWIVTAFMAYRFIRKRKIQLHKEWMIRSYVVTLAFVSFRVLNDNLTPLLGGSIDIATTLLWASWAVPLLVTNMVLDWKKN